MVKDQAERAIADHIAAVKSALLDSGSNAAQVSAIEREIRDHIDEAMSETDADYKTILDNLDPPENYQTATPNFSQSLPDRRGQIGFFTGLFCIACAFLILPNIGLEKLAPPFVVLGLIISATLGIAGRKGRFGLASLLLSVAILIFIIAMNIGGN